jgi:hypothetical protein
VKGGEIEGEGGRVEEFVQRGGLVEWMEGGMVERVITVGEEGLVGNGDGGQGEIEPEVEEEEEVGGEGGGGEEEEEKVGGKEEVEEEGGEEEEEAGGDGGEEGEEKEEKGGGKQEGEEEGGGETGDIIGHTSPPITSPSHKYSTKSFLLLNTLLAHLVLPGGSRHIQKWGGSGICLCENTRIFLTSTFVRFTPSFVSIHVFHRTAGRFTSPSKTSLCRCFRNSCRCPLPSHPPRLFPISPTISSIQFRIPSNHSRFISCLQRRRGGRDGRGRRDQKKRKRWGRKKRERRRKRWAREAWPTTGDQGRGGRRQKGRKENS